jgi:hypothetical protein
MIVMAGLVPAIHVFWPIGERSDAVLQTANGERSDAVLQTAVPGQDA